MAGNRDDRDFHSSDLDRPEVQHEEKDVNVWAIGKFALALVTLCVIAVLLLAGLFRYFGSREAARQAPPDRGIDANVSRQPPDPRLQDAPILDLKQMRDAENQILGSYEWIDREKGIVRLPIERAIDAIAQRGLPADAAPNPRPAVGDVSVPTESGLGPKAIQPGGPLAGEMNNSPAGQ